MSVLTLSDSYWLRGALATASRRDPIDALRDAERLVEILRSRAIEVVSTIDGTATEQAQLALEGGAQ